MSKNERKDLIERVLCGEYPAESLRKSSRSRLELLVLNLARCSSGRIGNTKNSSGLLREFCLNDNKKPEWWPSDKIIEESLTSDGKYCMALLRFLVYRCCTFFKKPHENLNAELFVTENDENRRKSKRKIEEPSSDDSPTKRRTLMPKSSCVLSSESTSVSDLIFDFKCPSFNSEDIVQEPTPLTQNSFLQLFNLQNNCNPDTEDPISPPVPNSSIKFISSTNIPFSSDLGLELMKADNHSCSEFLKSRRLDKVEWYINRPVSKTFECSFDVTYNEKKGITYRKYKFAKRQFGQSAGDVELQKRIDFCYPLRILLLQEDLEKLQVDFHNRPKPFLKVVLVNNIGSKLTTSH